ncbi:MAG: hypothetical protein P4M13_10275 [Alphaproteobacteria bacterium]|nr:hypothetical protein [Alphaproteobacteria bacterium]
MDELGFFHYLAVLRRRKKVFGAVALVLLALSVIFTLRWSNYQSVATVEIERPEVASNTINIGEHNASDGARDAANQRINEIAQKITSTASLAAIITKFNLYPESGKGAPIALLADAMRRKIKINLLSGAQGGSSTDAPAIAFTVSFDYTNPPLAQQVTQELVARILDEDLKEKHTEAQQTSAFLGDQIEALGKSLSEQEKKIEGFRKKYGLTRPEDLAFNQQAAETLTLDLQNLDTRIATNEGNIAILQGQLAMVDPYSRIVADGQILTTPSVELKALQTQYAALTSRYGSDHPDVVKVRHEIDALQSQFGGASKTSARLKAQIADARTNLVAAQKTYGPDDPDVLALQAELHKFQDQLALQPAQASSTNGIVADADNPAYLQLVAQLQGAEEQHKALLAQREKLQAERQSYHKAIMENPEAAKQMAELSRDYENAQQRFRELKEKKMSADMRMQVQEGRMGEKLSVIDPPELPTQTHPSRMLLLIADILISLAGGLGAVALSQLFSQSIVGAPHLEFVSGAAPLVSIPHIYTPKELDRSLAALFWRWKARGLGG